MNTNTNTAAKTLATMDYAEVETVSMVASTVRRELRTSNISLRSLRAIPASRPRSNPYDSVSYKMTPAVWTLILTVVGTRIDATCRALVELEETADRESQLRSTPAVEVLEKARAEVNKSAAPVFRFEREWLHLTPAQRAEKRESAHADGLEMNAAIDSDLSILRRDIAGYRKTYEGAKLAEVIAVAVRRVYARIVHTHGVSLSSATMAAVQAAPVENRYCATVFRIGDRVELDGLTYVVTMNKLNGVVMLNDAIEAQSSQLRSIERRDVIVNRIAAKCGVSTENSLQTYFGCEFNETAAISTIERRNAKANQESADSMAADFIADPAADIYRMSYPEVVNAMMLERGSPASTHPTARGFLALMIGRDESHLPPDVDTVRDMLRAQLVNCYQHKILMGSEWIEADALAEKSDSPRAMIAALKAALLTGVDIVEALKAGK